MVFLTFNQLSFIFGLLGNLVTFLVLLAPVPTFYSIYKKKSSEGYQSIPYVIALCSATLSLYYGFLKSKAYLIISINSVGCAIEIAYLILYLIYAPRKEKRFTLKLILGFNVGAFGVVMLITNFLLKGSQRVAAVGWICAAYNLAVFAAPLSIMKRVITTKSVEFMPFTLSFSLTICATMWFFYGFFVKDLFIAVPYFLGFLFGIAQMILYFIYKNKSKNIETTPKQNDKKEIKEMKMFVQNKAAESNDNNIV